MGRESILIPDVELENVLDAFELILDVIIVPEKVTSGCGRFEIHLKYKKVCYQRWVEMNASNYIALTIAVKFIVRSPSRRTALHETLNSGS